MYKIKMGVHVVVKSTKSDANANPVPRGRPRLKVDYAIVLRMREQYKMGWSRMAKRYREITGQFISPDTIKRRYFEARALEKNPGGQVDEWK